MSEPYQCAFCAEASTGLATDAVLNAYGMPRFGRKVLETDEFFVAPSLGPLTEDHCLLISRAHHNALRDAPLETIASALALAEALAAQLSVTSGRIAFIFENGPALGRGNEACVDHLHVHMLTLQAAQIQTITASLADARPVANSCEALTAVSRSHDYVFLHSPLTGALLHDGPDIERQLLRKLIAKAIGRGEEWNWRDYPRVRAVEAMVSPLRAAFG